MNLIYPLKFKPIFHEKIWGGKKLSQVLNKTTNTEKCGESWEISGVEGNVSEVENGFLAGNDLNEILEVYMGDLVGDKVYEKFGNEFPLLIKFIDANDDLSIQVHPDDAVAEKRHNSYGKTEMWYVMQADKDAKLIAGFNQKVTKETYLAHLNDNKLTDILNAEKVAKGDVFFIPAGRVHAIGAGILLAEIQQTSNITYRIYDYNRLGDDGEPRELHTDLALDVIDYTYHENYKTSYKKEINVSNKLVESQFFTTNFLTFKNLLKKDYSTIDSFVIYICTQGSFKIKYREKESLLVQKGETILIPAMLQEVLLYPIENEQVELLEVYIP